MNIKTSFPSFHVFSTLMWMMLWFILTIITMGLKNSNLVSTFLPPQWQIFTADMSKNACLYAPKWPGFSKRMTQIILSWRQTVGKVQEKGYDSLPSWEVFIHSRPINEVFLSSSEPSFKSKWLYLFQKNTLCSLHKKTHLSNQIWK